MFKACEKATFISKRVHYVQGAFESYLHKQGSAFGSRLVRMFSVTFILGKGLPRFGINHDLV